METKAPPVAEHESMPAILAKYEAEKKSITAAFMEMAGYHLMNHDKIQELSYNNAMCKLYDKVAHHTVKARELLHFIRTEDKNKKDELIAMLEDLPRQMGGFNIPLTLDLMFRADGHGFSKLLGFFKKIDLQPFSLTIAQTFITLVTKFLKTDEFKGMQTCYWCSDEITAVSKHGFITAKEQVGMHPFGAKRDKITSMISGTLSANFSHILEQATDAKLIAEISSRRKSFPTFDARVFPSNTTLIGHMFKSRVDSCYRNTVSELHDYFFGTKSGHGMNSKLKIKHMLDVFKFDFETMCPPCLKYGVFIKEQKAIVPLRKPIPNDKFVEFLYAKGEIEPPFEYILFEDMLKQYPMGHYIPEQVRNEKKIKYETEAKLNKEKELLKAEKMFEYPRPTKEETVRLRELKKKKKEQARAAVSSGK
ncbi:MAG: hypothetical protein Harvfovirus2_30 [Harvfovirus sp.]|uniref:tRNAHis guanylyltransferase catalytic domain-containing protein n=1 Tax=Harvfovirus sp. TaxID=2487768 RepID=A0A3G5A053_9VIRU|nr:MAG: hypothetical protein Harvfovirus2_30 [Harvfovirus sp.]